MSDKKWQEDFSQILELIRTTKEQLHRVKQRRASLWQMARCVYTARKHLQKAEKQLNKLHRTTETDDDAEKRLQSIELGEKDRQRATEIGDAAKELWRMDAQRTAKVLRTVSANPPGGEIAANWTITVTFDNAPVDVTVSAGTVTVAGKSATITGPFRPGALALTLTWADGTQALNYTVTSPD